MKALRSLGQGALFVTFAIYLDALGWSASSIGLLLSAGGLLNAALSLPIGVASDRLGRKAFVMANEGVIAAAAAMAALTHDPAVLAAASLLGAFGRGQVGMVGPAGPAEQAWIAELIKPSQRGRIYSENSALGFVGMGLGSLLAGTVPFWAARFGEAHAYRPFFVLVLVTSLINLALLARVGGGVRGAVRPDAEEAAGAAGPSRPARHPGAAPHSVRERRYENSLLVRLAGVNAMNGLAIGLTAPLLAYWFYIKFGAGPAALGPVFAVTYFATGLASVLTGRLAERVGLVRSVVAVRMLAVGLLVVLPLAPAFWLAGAIHVLRSALNRGTQGTRQALTISLVSDERRGFASSLNAISMSLPNALGPVIAGVMLEAGQLALPFMIAALMQFAYGVLFGRLFERHERRQALRKAAEAP